MDCIANEYRAMLKIKQTNKTFLELIIYYETSKVLKSTIILIYFNSLINTQKILKTQLMPKMEVVCENYSSSMRLRISCLKYRLRFGGQEGGCACLRMKEFFMIKHKNKVRFFL